MSPRPNLLVMPSRGVGRQSTMNYVKIFRDIPYEAAEETLNEFFADIERKGHRVMHTKYLPQLNELTAIFTVNSEPHPHKVAANKP